MWQWGNEMRKWQSETHLAHCLIASLPHWHCLIASLPLSPMESHRYAAGGEIDLQIPHAVFGKMKDGRRERGVGAAGGKHVGEMFRYAGAAGRNDRNPDGVADRR